MASSSSKNLPFGIEQFNGQGNFILWQERVKNILTREGTVKALKKKDEKPEKMTEKTGKTREILQTALLSCAWRTTLFKKLHVKKQFYDLRLSEGGSFEKHLDEFNRISTRGHKGHHRLLILVLVINPGEEAKKGHIKKHCFKWKRENTEKEKGEKGRGEETSSISVVTSGDLLLTCQGEVANLTDLEFGCIIDSGATLHVTSRKGLYTSYTPGDFGVIRMGNKGISPVVGRGDIILVTNNGTKLLLKDVHHVPDIRLNVISAGRLDDEGYCNTLCEGEWKLTAGSFVAK
ncbi:hypothetical protein Nepgr_015892 [Nepenthes gracilis]|uniref:Retrovirus-related Pol polyprotein from transposon TNT 1-94-like beta-barrel domain-containing protein n=1 Tax=Nepenthes gracilis TaxID=150966 RepID=A0AAD3SPF4_NEPGR|nr:hypothetical protein Nepgr_015892 [Nepenthes gracilis]